MSPSSLVAQERRALAEILLSVGPDAPTLCEGWTARDLVAHLVIREGRPDAAIGILGGPMAKWTAKVQDAAALQPFDELVATFLSGPPRWSPFSIAKVDAAANIVEFAVHIEDVRRAQPSWVAAPDNPELNEVLWTRLTKMGKLLLRGVTLGVEFQRTDQSAPVFAAKTGAPTVTLIGTPLDLVLRTYGRTEVDVQVTGDQGAVDTFNAAKFGI
ncbi:MAG: TIGR03085 family protein [Actinobacteria bacterium]|uniref:Unannotated protein n=1 Tax=freshwater metagenome TaxID=449393 RepID=A0A6J7FB86_9ZZZZ|nr:TIGR03085 family protein [Actinomycetota bacterium]